MKEILVSFKNTFTFLRKDKILLFFSIIPAFIGISLYALVGHWIFNKFLSISRPLIDSHIQNQNLGVLFYYFIVAIFGFILFFIVNWTFFLAVSVISSPFNDLISARVELLSGGNPPEDWEKSWRKLTKRAFKIIFNEGKKVILILILTFMALILNFIPILAPISLVISAALMSVQFLDYNWSRHDMNVRSCLNDFRKNFLPYTVSGLAFSVLMTIPIVNLLFLPLAVIFYTNLWNQKRNQNS